MRDRLDNVAVKSLLAPERSFDVTFIDRPGGMSEFLFAHRPEQQLPTENGAVATKSFLDADTPDALLQVFRRFGPLCQWMDSLSLNDAKNWQNLFRFLGSSQLTYEEMCSLRRDTVKMRVENANFDFLRLPELHTEWTSPLKILAVCADLMEAIAMTLFLDRANSRLWQLCGWKPCGKLFIRQSGSRKKFHDEKCAQKMAHWRWDQKGRLSEKAVRKITSSKRRSERKAR